MMEFRAVRARLGEAKTSLFSRPNAVFFGVIIVFTLLDQISKRWVEATVSPNTTSAQLIGHWLQITHVQNFGAAFNLLQGQGWLFGTAAVVVGIGILVMLTRMDVRERFTRLCLGLIWSGAVGNLVDRIRQGFVTDMIHFQIPEINFDFPVWNVADSCVFVGVVSMLIYSLIQERRAPG